MSAWTGGGDGTDEDAGRLYSSSEMIAVFEVGRAVGRAEGHVDRDVVETAERLSARLLEAGVSTATPSDLPAPRPRARHWPSRRHRALGDHR